MSDDNTTMSYTNGEVTIQWNKSICIHAAECVKGNKEVFDPQRRPWVDANAATTEAITEIIDRCPSGALSYKHNKDL